MRKISDAVQKIVAASEVSGPALRDGYLNLTAYAHRIRTEVEASTKKPVKTGSIVVALSRLRKSLAKTPPLIPRVNIDDLAVKSGLVEMAFDRTRDNLEKLRAAYHYRGLRASDFFVATQGMGEITLIAPSRVKAALLQIFRPHQPVAVIDNLAGLALRFNQKYISVPNVIYALVRPFALLRINIVEIISTFTEMTFIVEEKNLQPASSLLHELVKRNS